MECLASACRSTGFELHIADRLVEALEESPMLVVVDPSSADEEELRRFTAAAAEAGSRVMLLDAIDGESPAWEPELVDAPAHWSEESLRCILLNLRRSALGVKSRKRWYDRRMVRLAHILDRLDIERSISVDEIARAVGVSRRTVLRDLEILRSLGVWMDYDRKMGTYRVRDGWSPDLI